jgi:hypothetical protein
MLGYVRFSSVRPAPFPIETLSKSFVIFAVYYNNVLSSFDSVSPEFLRREWASYIKRFRITW